jgi:hypothetical protein
MSTPLSYLHEACGPTCERSAASPYDREGCCRERDENMHHNRAELVKLGLLEPLVPKPESKLTGTKRPRPRPRRRGSLCQGAHSDVGAMRGRGATSWLSHSLAWETCFGPTARRRRCRAAALVAFKLKFKPAGGMAKRAPLTTPVAFFRKVIDKTFDRRNLKASTKYVEDPSIKKKFQFQFQFQFRKLLNEN